MTESDLSKLSTFHTKSMRGTLRLFCPNTISNQDLLDRCQQENMATNIFRRRWNWIGHVLRSDSDSIIKTALFQTLGGGRMEAEIKEQKRTWAHSKQTRMENVSSLLPYTPKMSRTVSKFSITSDVFPRPRPKRFGQFTA